MAWGGSGGSGSTFELDGWVGGWDGLGLFVQWWVSIEDWIGLEGKDKQKEKTQDDVESGF